MAMFELLRFISVCFPLLLQEPGQTVRYTHWGNTAWCAQDMLPIETARDHFGIGFECALSDQDACEREAVDLQETLRCFREAQQYGKEAECGDKGLATNQD